MSETTYDPLAELDRTAKRIWWLVLLQGIVAIAFGLLALLRTGDTLLAIVVLFGVYAFVDGVLRLWAGIVTGVRGRGWLVFEGIVGIAVGIIAWRHPEATSLALLLVIAVWALAIGGMELYAGAGLARARVPGAGWTIASGVLSIIVGFLLVLNPFAGVATMVWVVGIYAIVFGATIIGSAFTLRRAATRALGR